VQQGYEAIGAGCDEERWARCAGDDLPLTAVDGGTILVHGGGQEDVQPGSREHIDPLDILDQIRRRPGA
jgi:hypothetical protein